MSMPEAGGKAVTHSAAEWLARVVGVERRGELLSACDFADQGLEEHPGDTALQHRAVLALARAGSTEQAAERLGKYGLVAAGDEDVRALEARIAKDVAFAAGGGERPALAARSAALYEAIFTNTGGYYPGINAATLRLIAGDEPGAARLARRVLEIVRRRGEDGYYAAASEVEALLVLGDVAGARSALKRAAALNDGDYGALASTRRQLLLVCEQRGIDSELLSVLAGPRVLHYCGHRIGASSPLRSELETQIALAIGDEIERYQPAYAYGSLANGADILFAEALLARDIELHVVLPFARDEFVEASVANAGGDWSLRFEHCLAAVTDVRYATDDAFLGDDVLYRYGAELAMGLALVHARFLGAEVRQIAVWDGEPARGEAGTAIDVSTWTCTGRQTTVVSIPEATPSLPATVAAAGSAIAPRGTLSPRVIRALLFADVKGFSALSDEQLPRFAEYLLGSLAATLDRHRAHVLHRNTWGDALYVVLEGVTEAAECALDLQDAVTSIDLPSRGLPEHLALRLGAHLGPVFAVRDPILDSAVFMGSHVSRTARIEPVTPPGAVYVTEAFAAALELHGSPFACDYVGHMPAAKDFGRLRMYRLRRASSTPSGL
jgi:class 3 adenylate cyclase